MKKKMMINSVIILFLASIFFVEAQENIEFKYVNRMKVHHQTFLDLCNIDIRKKYEKLANKSSDSIKIYAEEFRKSTEITIQTNKEEFVILVSKDYLIHQRYIDFILLKKEKLLSDSSFTICIKSDSPDYPDHNVDYEFVVENLDKKLINSKSLIIKFNEYDNLEKRHVLLEFSPVDEVDFEKIKKECVKKAKRN